MIKKQLIIYFFIAVFCTLIFSIFQLERLSYNNILLLFLISVMYSYFIGFGQAIINYYLDKKWNWKTQTNQRLYFGILVTIISVTFSVILCNYINFNLIQGKPLEDPNLLWTNFFWIIFSLGISAIFHANGFLVELKKSSERENIQQKIIAQSATSQLAYLKSQLDPHFLFNSLNVLDSLIEENPKRAKAFVTSLSKIYRYILDQRDHNLVLVEQELEFSQNYTQLLKMRFEDILFLNRFSVKL